MPFPKPNISTHPKGNSQTQCCFSILIPSWNNLEMLQCCIASLESNSHFPHQIIVHVNEGFDGTLDWVKNQGFDYTYSAGNAGVCYAVNAMAKLAQTDYLLYLNDDMYVCRGWDVALKNAADGMPDPMWYLSGTMIEPTGKKNTCAISPHNFGRHPGEFLKTELDNFAAGLNKSDWFGSCWPPSLVHKTLFDQVGGYSELFSPGMYSDPDFAMKLWKAGVRHFRGIGACLVYHFQSKSTGRVKKNNGRKQFAAQWGITASYFYRYVLQMGENYQPSVKLEMTKNAHYYLARLKSFLILLKK